MSAAPLTATTARLVAEPLDVDWTPAQAVTLLRGDDRPFALSGTWSGGSTIVGSEPVRVALPDEDPFAIVAQLPTVASTDAPPGAVGGGWFGYLGFTLAHEIERLPPAPPRRTGLPPFGLALYDHVLRRDADGRWWFEALETPGRSASLAARRAELLARVPRARPFRAGPFAPAPPGTTGLADAVAECVERIAAGELFQANLTMRVEGPFAGDPIDAFARGLTVEPLYGALFTGPEGATVSLSPELFLRREGRDVITRPIKGTRPRTGDDDGAREELAASAKDRAENVMIVDLMRNDLGRVSAFGTVHADPAPVVEAHPGVWHLVTSVTGHLRTDVTDEDLLRATFPPGSVTGAPKVQSLIVISELEGSERHAYTGAMGYVSPVAGLELNVAIRTFEIADGVAWIGAGGGIVADSVPENEVREALDKARPNVAALGATLHAEPPRTAPRIPRALRDGRRRPDPAQGIFDTLAVRDGRAISLDAHLARLAQGAREVLGAGLPATLDQEIARAVTAAPDPARLRIDVGPEGVAVAVKAAAEPTLGPVALAPVVLPGGLGPYKWRDRTLVDELARLCGGLPLLVDSDGNVLEASMANVWIVEGAALVTPPADGRILPGVTRARLLALPEAREEPFDLGRLRAADAVLISSSISLVRPASEPVPAARIRALWDTLST